MAGILWFWGIIGTFKNVGQGQSKGILPIEAVEEKPRLPLLRTDRSIECELKLWIGVGEAFNRVWELSLVLSVVDMV